MRLPGWLYCRNVLILIATVGIGTWALAQGFANPLHWLWVAPLLFFWYVLWRAFFSIHPPRLRYWLPFKPDFASPVYEKVLFKSRDGLDLFGWYLPGRNRAALLLVHGLGGAGISLVFHAAPFVKAGYGVFLIDLRAHGSSDGNLSTGGAQEALDVAGAVDYLLKRPDVDGDKIGALGISLGAQAVLRGALESEAVHALALEGLGPVCLEDHGGRPQTLQRWINYPLNWFTYALLDFLSGVSPKAVVAAIGQIAPRPLLLIACGNFEIHFNRLFCAAAHEPKALWELPRARHAAALSTEPKQYPERLIRFFDQALHVEH